MTEYQFYLTDKRGVDSFIGINTNLNEAKAKKEFLKEYPQWKPFGERIYVVVGMTIDYNGGERE